MLWLNTVALLDLQEKYKLQGEGDEDDKNILIDKSFIFNPKASVVHNFKNIAFIYTAE